MLSRRTDVAALTGVFVFGAFANAAGMISPVMMWEHRWHARLGPGSMPAIVAAFIVAATVILPAIGLLLCAALNRPQRSRVTAQAAERPESKKLFPLWLRGARPLCANILKTHTDSIRRFMPALVPLGFGMWAAHTIYHLATARATVPDWLIPAQLILLDGGLLLTLYVSWRLALHYAAKPAKAVPLAAPWAALACSLYAIAVWILFQPMQMRGAM